MKEITKEEFEEKYKDYPEVYNIDDTSMYESCIIEESFSTKDEYKDLIKYLRDLRHHPSDHTRSKFAAPFSPEEIKDIGEKYSDTAVYIKDLVDKLCEES